MNRSKVDKYVTVLLNTLEDLELVENYNMDEFGQQLNMSTERSLQLKVHAMFIMCRDPQISRLAKSRKISVLEKTVRNMFLNQIKNIDVGFDSRNTREFFVNMSISTNF